MSSINLQYGNISTNCLDKIDSVIKSLNKSLNYLQAFDIPRDFSRRTQLLNAISNIKIHQQDLMNIRNSIVNSNNDYNSVTDNILDVANHLPVDKIKKRSTII